MSTRLIRVTAVVLTIGLSACASPAPMRIGMERSSGSQMNIGRGGPSFDCGDGDSSSFNTPDAMKLPKDAFGCVPQ